MNYANQVKNNQIPHSTNNEANFFQKPFRSYFSSLIPITSSLCTKESISCPYLYTMPGMPTASI